MTKRRTTAEKTPADAKAFEAYNATASSPHRAAPANKIVTGDNLLPPKKRKIGTATAKEAETNSALLAWMIRKHLDYVSRFSLNFRSGDEALDREMQGLLDWHGRRMNFDIARRHGRDQFLRLFETNKVFSGDAAALMLAGGKMQGLESDQIGMPDDWGKPMPPKQKRDRVSPHGLVLGEYGEVLEYCICFRNGHGRLVFDHFERAENVVFDGYFTSFSQTRAPSPILAAINDVIDLTEIQLMTKINLKLKNLFGIAIFRDLGDPLGGASSDEEGEESPATSQELSAEQVNILDLDQNDKVQSVETNSPGANSIEFMDKLARIAMLALDIPYTSLDSSRASFSARIGDRAEYEESAAGKRTKNADVLREIYAWRISDWYNTLPEFRAVADAAGYNAGRLIRELDIIPSGTPWLDKLNEVKGDMLSVALGLESIPRLARKRGLDAYKIGKEQSDYLAWAGAHDLPIFYAAGGQQSIQQILDSDSTNNDEEGNINE